MTHDRDDELREFFTDGGDPSQRPEHPLRDDPDVRGEVDELLDTVRALDAVGRRERGDLAAATGALPEGRAEEHLRDLIRGAATVSTPADAAPRTRPAWLRFAGLAAAVLVIASALWSTFFSERGSGGSGLDTPLGTGISVVFPVGPQDVIDRFEFEPLPPTDGCAIIRVYDADQPDVFDHVLKSEELRATTTWKPKPDELEQLPKNLRWTVDFLQGSAQTFMGRAEGTASQR